MTTPNTLTCLACGRSYLDVPPFIVDTLPGLGLTAWCVECDSVISLGEKKSLVTAVINEWRAAAIAGDMDALEDAGHRFVERQRLLLKETPPLAPGAISPNRQTL